MLFGADDLLRVFTNPQLPNVPDISRERAEAFVGPLTAALIKHGGTNRRRVAHYLAQAGYESGCFSWLEEFGGSRAWYAPYYGRGAVMLTHEDNYREVGDRMGVDLVGRPGRIGCEGDEPTRWPRNPELSMEVGPAFFRWKNLWVAADQGDEGFDPIMRRVLGTTSHPSYADRWALYRACINRLPRPLFVGA